MNLVIGKLEARGNISVRPTNGMNKGDVIVGHAHNFDHLTYIPSGAALIEKLEVVKEAVHDGHGNVVTQPEYKVVKAVEKRASDGYNFLLIEAGVIHRITALEDNTHVHCIYANRNPQGEVVQEYDGWGPAYV